MLRSELDSVPSIAAARATGVGYAAATAPVAAHAITTDAAGLVAGAVTIDAGDFALPAYRARPEGDGPFPIVVVVSEIFGVHEYIADVARRFARSATSRSRPSSSSARATRRRRATSTRCSRRSSPRCPTRR